MHQFARWTLVAAVTLALPLLARAQTTLHVPGDYPVIQWALDAAPQGTIVLVQPGLYVEGIIWPDRPGIKLISAGDASNTFIDGDEWTTVIDVDFSDQPRLDTTTVIKGFTIQNGNGLNHGQRVGGIRIRSAGVVLEDVHVIRSVGYTGGVLAEASSLVLRDVVLRNNVGTLETSVSPQTKGGGLLVEDGRSVWIKRTSIHHNYNDRLYGGAGIQAVDIYVDGLRVINNESGTSVGGLGLNGYFDTIVRDLVVANNFANEEAGGLRLEGSFDIDGMVVCDNLALNRGGGILIDSPEYARIRNGTICRNESRQDEGGAIAVAMPRDRYTFSMEDMAIVENADPTAALFVDQMGSIKLTSSIISDNVMGVFNHTHTYVDASRNWWGAAAGPKNWPQNPAGTGDEVSTFVNVLPFADTPPTTAAIPPPTGVRKTGLAATGARVSWDASPHPDVVGYRVFWNLTDDWWTAGYSASFLEVGAVTEVQLPAGVGPTATVGIRAITADGRSSWYSSWNSFNSLTATVHTGVETALPKDAPSLAVFPNPVRGMATARLSLQDAQPVRLEVSDIQGRIVRRIASPARPGTVDLAIDFGGLPSGVYFVRQVTDSGSSVAVVTHLK